MELVRGRPASMDGSGTMKTRFWLRRGLALGRIGFGLGLVAAASLGVQTGGLAASSPGYSLANVGPYGGGAPSCSPFGVARDWVAASIPAGGTTNTAEVVLMYHDFYGPSQIWVNISHDGGATFGPPQEVLASPSVTPGAVAGTLMAQGYTFCNTVPAGVQIVRPGLPHAGRIFVAWIAADLAQNATGCNVSMLQSFHTLWISYSDDGGLTWTAHQAFDAGIGPDAP